MRTGLRLFWLFRGLARTCGPVLVLIGVGLLFSDITLLRILLPFRFIVAECSLIGSVVSVIAWYFGKRAGAGRVGQSILLLSAVGGLIFGILQYRAESLAYRQTFISFDNQDAQLVGTLYLPNRPAPSPGIVIVHGSGRFWRRFYHVFADHLVCGSASSLTSGIWRTLWKCWKRLLLNLQSRFANHKTRRATG